MAQVIPLLRRGSKLLSAKTIIIEDEDPKIEKYAKMVEEKNDPLFNRQQLLQLYQMRCNEADLPENPL